MIRLLQSNEILSNKDAYNMLLNITEKMSFNRAHVYLSKDDSIGSGFSDGVCPDDIVIGVNGISNNVFPVNERKFISALVAIYHEIRHVEQYYNLRHQDTDFGKQLAISHKAFVANPSYAEDNYPYNPCEIDAERFGVTKAYEFCVSNFGEQKANDLLCKYVNFSVKHNISFVYPYNKVKYTDIIDILDDFDEAYDRSIHHTRSYDINKGLIKHDITALFLMQNLSYKHYFKSEQDGQLQDKQMAVVAMYWAGYSDDRIPVLENLSFSSVFDDELKFDRQLPDIDYDAVLGNEDYYTKE